MPSSKKEGSPDVDGIHGFHNTEVVLYAVSSSSNVTNFVKRQNVPASFTKFD